MSVPRAVVAAPQRRRGASCAAHPRVVTLRSDQAVAH